MRKVQSPLDLYVSGHQRNFGPPSAAGSTLTSDIHFRVPEPIAIRGCLRCLGNNAASKASSSNSSSSRSRRHSIKSVETNPSPFGSRKQIRQLCTGLAKNVVPDGINLPRAEVVERRGGICTTRDVTEGGALAIRIKKPQLALGEHISDLPRHPHSRKNQQIMVKSAAAETLTMEPAKEEQRRSSRSISPKGKSGDGKGNASKGGGSKRGNGKGSEAKGGGAKAKKAWNNFDNGAFGGSGF